MLFILLHRPDLNLPWVNQPHVNALSINRLDQVQVSSMIQSLTQGKVLPKTVLAGC